MQADELRSENGTEGQATPPEGEADDPTGTSITVGDVQVNQGGTVVIAGRDAQVGYSLAEVERLLEKLGREFQPKPFTGKCPYPGLEAFREADASLFFGRETQIAALLERVKTRRFLMIAGPSGSGKSSLVRAGLLAKLKAGALEDSQSWLYATLQPGRQPLEQLALAMSRTGRSPQAAEYLRERTSQPKALHEVAESLLGDDPGQRMILFVDQFEEIFTQTSSERQADRQAFLDLLTTAASLENGRVTVLCAMRSDFLPHCAPYAQLNALLNQQFFQLGALQPEELVRAVALPAAEVGLRLDPRLVAKVVEDVGSEPGILPLMQFALKDLFEASQATSGVMELTFEGYLQRGGLHKALQRHAEAEFSRLSASEQELAETVFSGLVEIGKGSVDTRRSARFSELVPAGTDPAKVQALVQQLADARLLTTDEAEGQEQVVFIPHERLLDCWPWLRRLVDENRQVISLQNDVNEDAQAWESSGFDPSYLYSGARLSAAQEKVQTKKLRLSQMADRFITAGIKARDAASLRRRRITRLTISGLAAAVLIFAFLAGWAFLAQQRAIRLQRISRSRELAALALNQVENNRPLAILLAREALLTEQTTQAQDALRQTLLALPGSNIFQPEDGAEEVLAVSPDGKLVIIIPGTSSAWFSVEAWDTTRAEKVRTLELDSHADGAAFSPDGRWAAVLGLNEIKVWDTTSDRDYSIDGLDVLPENLVFSPDSGTLYLLGTPTLAWDTASGRQKYAMKAHSLALSPDGQLLFGWDEAGGLGIWQAKDGSFLRSLQTDSQVSTEKAAFSPDNQRLLALQGGGDVRIWEVSTGQQVLLHQSPAWLDDVGWVKNGGIDRFLTREAASSEVRIWDAQTDLLLMTLRETQQRGQAACSFKSGWSKSQFTSVPALNNVVVSPDSLRVLTTAAWIARIWDPVTGQPVMVNNATCSDIQKAFFTHDQRRLVFLDEKGIVYAWDIFPGELPTLAESQDPIVAAAYSPDDESLATIDASGMVNIWFAATGEKKLSFSTRQADSGNASVPSVSPSLSLDYAPDGKQLLITDLNGATGLWQADTGQLNHSLASGQTQAIFSPDGSRIASVGADGALRIWESATGSLLHELRSDFNFFNASFSQDGQRLLGAGEHAAVWETTSGKLLRTLDAELFNHASLSPDGKYILTSQGSELFGGNGFAVWEVETGKKIYEVSTLLSKVNQVIYSPDGQLVLTLSDTPQVFNAQTGAGSIMLRGMNSPPSGATFSPDGRWLVITSQDGTAHQYVVRVEDLLSLGLTRAGYELSCDDREVYLGEQGACGNAK
jgi:WD40 repeat protein